MKMRYCLVDEQATPQIVLASYPFRWMATVHAVLRGGDDAGYGVAEVPVDPQTVIHICHHRDQLIDRVYGESGRGDMVDVMFGLVARGDDGRWTTVHDADVPLPEAAQKVLDKAFA